MKWIVITSRTPHAVAEEVDARFANIEDGVLIFYTSTLGRTDQILKAYGPGEWLVVTLVAEKKP